jgi:hypothetical protein
MTKRETIEAALRARHTPKPKPKAKTVAQVRASSREAEAKRLIRLIAGSPFKAMTKRASIRRIIEAANDADAVLCGVIRAAPSR